MAIVGKGAKSIKKKDLANQKSIGVGFKKLRFWHKASAGETGINLLSLVFPTELQPSGRQNPSKHELANANIRFFKSNLTVRSSLRGVLMDGLAYDVPNATRINWIGFTAAEDEIFEVTLDENAKTGRNIVDGRQVIASGILPAGETDINLGPAFEINKNPNANVGAVTLHLDRALQLRNTNNSSTTKDKDYHEVDPGGGLGIILRVNTPDLSNDREYVVMSLGVVAEKPNESQLQEIEKVQGQIDAMVPTLAALAGVDESDFQSSGPNNIDLKAFGDQVIDNKNLIESILDIEVPIMTDWASFTPTVNWANVTPTGLWRRVGDTIEVEIKLTFTGAGEGSTLLVNWGNPLGFTRDGDKLIQLGATASRGIATYFDAGSNQYWARVLDVNSEEVQIAHSGTRNGIGVILDVINAATDPLTWATNDAIMLEFKYPITGWEAKQTIREALGL